MNPIIVSVFRYAIAGILILSGFWVFYIVFKSKNTLQKTSGLMEQGRSANKYGSRKSVLLTVLLLVFALLLAWMGNR